MIEVTYRTPAQSNLPNEITSVTLKQDHVPRVGEWLSLIVKCNGSETARIAGCVKTVDWLIREQSTVTVTVSRDYL